MELAAFGHASVASTPKSNSDHTPIHRYVKRWTDVSDVCTLCGMGKDERLNFRLGPELRLTLRTYTARYERSEADVIREALWTYLESKGYGPKTGGQRRR